MKSLYILPLILLFAKDLAAQDELKNFVLKNTEKIDLVSPNNFHHSDLNVLSKAIGDSRIVMLGEQDHGDAITYLAKARIIEYLHDSLGFNILAFESDFYSLNQGWKNVTNSKISISDYIKQNIYPVWTLCQECSNVFNYIKSQFEENNKLIITGFDNDMLGTYSQLHFKNEIIDFLNSTDISFIKDRSYKNTFIPYIDSIWRYIKEGSINEIEEDHIKITDSLSNIILNELRKRNFDTTFEYVALENFQSNCKYLILLKQNKIIDAISLRDKQMSQNLLWILQHKYPNQKIIIWAANSHIMRNLIDTTYPFSMAYYISRESDFAGKMYIMGFTDYSGSAGRIYSKPYNISLSRKASLESWVNEKGYDYAFIDFKNSKKLKNVSFMMRGQDHFQTGAKWMSIFDGIFYIKKIRPCTVK